MAGDEAAAAVRPRPLEGIRAVDMAGPFGAYAARLLADLGAQVTRVIPPGGDPLAGEAPLVATSAGEQSAFAWFANLGKDIVELDPLEPAAGERLDALLAEADLLLESWGTDGSPFGNLDRSRIAARFPRLTVVSMTPFGVSGPKSGDPGTDLTTMAAGGLLSLGGYADSAPIGTPGQARLGAAIFGAAAAIFGLIARESDGRGRQIDVAGQEVMAAALEDAIPQYDLTGTIRRRVGDTPREAGTGIFRCADGYVSMVAGRLGTARAWRSLVGWLNEAGIDGAEQLRAEPWDSLAHRQRPESVRHFVDVFERFAAGHTKAELYAEAQRRDIALAPINEIPEVLADAQLAERRFFAPVYVAELGRELLVPGRPYRLSDDAAVDPPRASAGVPLSANTGRQ